MRSGAPRNIPRRLTLIRKHWRSSRHTALTTAGLADAYAKPGQTDKAVQYYAAAAQADPANAAGTYYFNEGAVFTNTGKVDDAIAAFNKAIELDPNRADAYYWKGVDMIGKATMKDNKMVAPHGTAEAFNKYLELQPTGKYADAAKQMLATIGAPRRNHATASRSRSKKKSVTKLIAADEGGRVPPFFHGCSRHSLAAVFLIRQ